MSLSLKILFSAFLLLPAHVIFFMGASAAIDNTLALKGHDMDVVAKRGDCMRGGECMWEEELEMDSEINRRILAVQRKYISYDSLKKDQVPCTLPGASYYDCHGLVQAHPYNRGCTVITGCDRDSTP